MKEKEKKNTIVKRMIFAVAAGFVVGFSHALFEGISSGKREIRNMENSGCNLFSRCNKDKRN